MRQAVRAHLSGALSLVQRRFTWVHVLTRTVIRWLPPIPLSHSGSHTLCPSLFVVVCLPDVVKWAGPDPRRCLADKYTCPRWQPADQGALTHHPPSDDYTQTDMLRFVCVCSLRFTQLPPSNELVSDGGEVDLGDTGRTCRRSCLWIYSPSHRWRASSPSRVTSPAWPSWSKSHNTSPAALRTSWCPTAPRTVRVSRLHRSVRL